MGRRVDGNRLAGAEAAARDDVLVVEVDDSRLGRRHDVPVVRDLPAQGPEARAVEVRAGHDPVRERDGRGAVPRLDEARVEVVERAKRLGQVALRRVRDEHRERMERVPPRAYEELERLVEARRVAPLVRQDRQEALQAVAPDRRGELGLARAHRVAVAPERVDLAVVREEVERLRERPARERVRRVALVEHRDARRVVGVFEVRVEGFQLRPGQERLVDDRPVRDRHHPEAVEPLGLRAAGRDAAREVKAALPLVGVGARRRREKRVAHGRARLLGPVAEAAEAHGHLAPAEERQTLVEERLLDDGGRLLLGAAREEERRDAERRALRQRDSAPRRVPPEERLRDARQDTGAVAGPVAAGGAAVGDARESPKSEAQDAVRRLARVCHEADTTGVVLAVRVPAGVHAVRPLPPYFPCALGHPGSFPLS